MVKFTLRIVALVAVAVATFGCERKPTTAAAPPPPESAAPSTAQIHTVVGKGPRAVGGLPAIIVLEPQPPRDFPVSTRFRLRR